METSYVNLFAILIVLIGVVSLIIGWRFSGSSQLERRLHEFVVEPDTSTTSWQQETFVPRQEISGSFVSRTILPLFRSLGRLFGRFVPGKSIAEIDRQLVIADNPLGMRGREFYGIRIIFLILGGVLAFLILTRFNGTIYLIIALVGVVSIFFIPKLWLRSMVRRRQDRIRRELPDALDMLSVCADAGLGFDQSLQRLSEEWDSTLANEFGRVVTEMNMGETRASAMRNMADRLDVRELSSFVAVILQSYELGMGISDTLHAQANQMRIERRYWAQEQARKIPLKMLFPLIFLIFPAMFAVILGPAIPALQELFTGLDFSR